MVDLDVRRPAMRSRQLLDDLAHHPPRRRIDGGLADRQRQARLGNRADPFAGRGTGCRCRPSPNRTSARIRAPWVTSGSSPASFTMPAMATSGFSSARANGEARPFALRQRDLDRIGKPAGQQRREARPWSPPWRRRRWSSRGAAVRRVCGSWRDCSGWGLKMASRAGRLSPTIPAWSTLSWNCPRFEPGSVWLAGAGPGDPGLLTLLALHGLRHADAVVLRRSCQRRHPRSLTAPGTLLEFAGKRGGKPSAKQPDISRRLIQLAREGRRVLRLKGGDPFIFGRGGEEALALVAAGVPFRVVPGISAGIGGLAYAGIPITHRDVNSAVTFVTGHDASGAVPDTVDWEALAKGSPVIVVYMALKHITTIAETPDRRRPPP